MLLCLQVSDGLVSTVDRRRSLMHDLAQSHRRQPADTAAIQVNSCEFMAALPCYATMLAMSSELVVKEHLFVCCRHPADCHMQCAEQGKAFYLG